MRSRARAGFGVADYNPPSRRRFAVAAAWVALAFVILACIGFVPDAEWLHSEPSFLPIHPFLEAFACAVSVLIFGVGWYAARAERMVPMTVLSAAFLAVALLDFAHILSFAGMPVLVTAAGTEASTGFELAARYAQAVGLLGFALCPVGWQGKRFGSYVCLTAALAYVALVYWTVRTPGGILPPTFVPGLGPTPFKIAAEYGVMALLLVTAGALLLRLPWQQDLPVPLLFAAVLMLVATELAETLHRAVSDAYIVIGHLYKVIAFWLIYQAIFVRGVTQPYRDRVASETLYRQLTEAAADAILQLDRDGRIVTANRRVQELTGVPLDQVRGARLEDLLTPAPPTRVSGDPGALADQTTVFEAAVAHPDGGVVPVEISISALDGGGRLAIARDISERKRSEQAIRIRDIAFASSITPIALLTLDGRTSYVNHAFLDLWGYDDESEILGRGAEVFFADPAQGREVIATLQRDGLWSGDVRCVKRGGAMIDVQVSSNVVNDDDGKPICMIGSFRDITEQKAAIEALRDSEHRFSSFFNTSPTGMAIIDLEGRCIHVNPSRAQRRESDLLGKLPAEIFAPDVARRIEATQRRVLDTGKPNMNEEISGSFLDEPGRTYRWLFSHFPLTNGDGEIAAIGAVVIDMTALADMEAQLRQAQRIDALGKLTGGIAHDSNNYLGVVIGNLDLLREIEAHNPEAQQLINDALGAALRGAELTRSLLAFARRQPLDPRRIDLNDRIPAITNLLKRTLGEDITVTINLAPDLWPVTIDAAQLDSCIVNLANNARDAMPHGGALLIATSNVRLDEDFVRMNEGAEMGAHVLIQVTDTGAGMAPETKARVFEPFFTTKSPGTGTGLGLSMVYGFVKQSGGFITIDSTPGNGTTVRIYLPQATPSDVPAAVEPGAPAIAPQAGTETVLVVEDNDAMRKIVTRQVRSLGYRVIEAANGAAGLAILEQSDLPVDLLFSDIIMPGTPNGAALARLAPARRPNIKVLLTSGFSDDLMQQQNIERPGVRLLRKPYRINDLAQALKSALTSEPYPIGGQA